MKKSFVRLGQILLVLCVLSIPTFAGEIPHDGYLVKLTDHYPELFSLNRGPANIMVVDTLAEAESITKEYVEYIEPNYLVELFDLDDSLHTDWLPNDPLYANYQQPLQALDGLALYRAGLTGEGVKVGFVDSGIYSSHEDLNGSRISGINFHSDGLTLFRSAK